MRFIFYRRSSIYFNLKYSWRKKGFHVPTVIFLLYFVCKHLVLIHSMLLDYWIVVSEFQFTSAYRHFVNTKEALEILSLKILFSGPPRIGKTSARRRLEGEIVDLMSAGEADLVQPSTGAVESGSGMIIQGVSSSDRG